MAANIIVYESVAPIMSREKKNAKQNEETATTKSVITQCNNL